MAFVRSAYMILSPEQSFSFVANDPNRVAGLWSGGDTPSSWKAVRTSRDLLKRSGAVFWGREVLRSLAW